MLWHIMAYSHGLDYPYSRPYAVHLFTREKPAPEEAFRLAEEILIKTFPDLDRSGLVYVGYESIPVDVDGFYYVATRLLRVRDQSFEVGNAVSTVPPQLASAIEEYRRRYINLDYDDEEDSTRARLLDALEYLSELGCTNIRVFRTQRGYQVRAELPSPLPLEKILETREKLGENSAKISVDKAYLQKQLGFLTNLLFSSKCFRYEGRIYCHDRTEIDASSITAVRVETISIPLPAMKIELPKGTIEIDGKQIKFIGRFTARDVRNIVMSIEDNLWEYAYAQKTSTISDKDIKAKIVKAYSKISKFLAAVVDNCDVRFENGVAVIHVPESLQSFVGRLIGKDGKNIRAVEAEVGVKIKLEQEAPPPDEVVLKRKFQELLKQVT
ncbi:MAG: KH domain-containing protein [Thermofilaceae archaeon]